MMNKTLLIALAVALVTPFAAIADPDVFGIPDVTCQSPAEWRLHDYGPPATDNLVFLPQDGNLDDCGTRYVFGANCGEVRPFVPPIAYPTLEQFLCQTDLPADWDGDSEWAVGGGWLASNSGDGVTYGSIACLGIEGHHPSGGFITVTDAVLPQVNFSVTADYWDPGNPLPQGGTDCGDGSVEPCDPTPPPPSTQPFPVNVVVDSVNVLLHGLLNGPYVTCNPLDQVLDCLDHCVIPFGPGADGSYTVFVGPTLSGGPDRTPTGATLGHIYL